MTERPPARDGATETSGKGTVECVPYRPSMRSDLAALWSELFSEQRNFQPMTPERWRDRIELANRGEAFEPELFRVAFDGSRPVGFIHGGIWEGPFLSSLVPENDPQSGGFSAMGYVALVGVDVEWRRRGVGTALIDSLRAAIGRLREPGLPLVVDGRAYNAFYGNFFAPRPPLWGTTEGVAVEHRNVDARAFLESVGFRVEREAVSLTMAPAEYRAAPRQAYEPEIPIEVVEDDDYQAILGARGGAAFPYPNASHSWVAIHERTQIGCLIAYPFDETARESKRWGIHSLEVSPEHRGRGVARQVLARAVEFWEARGVEEVEALVLPEESPGAQQLYATFGFEEAARWWVFA
ncbi:MAG: GNAT family N-acetyltransferase [Planctomycetota bacterium]